MNEGTKSHVGIIEPNGRIGSTYVHYDGIPTKYERCVKHHFKNKDVKDFIKKGGDQGLYKGKDPEYYGKNGFFASGKFNDLEKYYRSVDQRGGSASFIYLFNMKDKNGMSTMYYKGDELKDFIKMIKLKNILNEEPLNEGPSTEEKELAWQ